jgi:outer membrane protein TolC
VGFQASWDIFDWGSKQKQIEAMQDAEAKARLEVEEAQALVLVDVGHQHRRVIEGRKELELARALQSASSEALRVVRNRYVQREALLSDVVKVQSGVAEANHRYTQALLDLATAQADLKKAMGLDQ